MCITSAGNHHVMCTSSRRCVRMTGTTYRLKAIYLQDFTFLLSNILLSSTNICWRTVSRNWPWQLLWLNRGKISKVEWTKCVITEAYILRTALEISAKMEHTSNIKRHVFVRRGNECWNHIEMTFSFGEKLTAISDFLVFFPKLFQPCKIKPKET